MDCEGCEASALVPWLDHLCTEQVVVELHAFPSQSYARLLRRLAATHIPFYAEHNPSCERRRCVEISWVRRHPCPERVARREDNVEAHV